MQKLNCIILIDDDSTTNYLTERLIRRMGLTDQVLVSKNGKEGLELIEQLWQNQGILPELILLDINMPVMNGFDFVKAFRERTVPNQEAVRIAVLTTSSNPADIHEMKNLGITTYLTKPLKAETLLEVLSL